MTDPRNATVTLISTKVLLDPEPRQHSIVPLRPANPPETLMIHRVSERIALIALLMSTGLTSALRGQSIGGTVRDAATSGPVSGAVVMLLGATREPVARTITSSSGAFRLSGENAAVLRVIRIGYTPFEQRVDGSTGTVISIELVPLGTRLRPVAVNTQPVCPAR